MVGPMQAQDPINALTTLTRGGSMQPGPGGMGQPSMPPVSHGPAPQAGMPGMPQQSMQGE